MKKDKESKTLYKKIVAVVGIFFVAFILGIFFTALTVDYFNQMVFETETMPRIELGLFWVCMDGCSNMQEIIFPPYKWANQSMKALHNKCGEVCWDQYTKSWGEYN